MSNTFQRHCLYTVRAVCLCLCVCEVIFNFPSCTFYSHNAHKQNVSICILFFVNCDFSNLSPHSFEFSCFSFVVVSVLLLTLYQRISYSTFAFHAFYVDVQSVSPQIGAFPRNSKLYVRNSPADTAVLLLLANVNIQHKKCDVKHYGKLIPVCNHALLLFFVLLSSPRHTHSLMGASEREANETETAANCDHCFTRPSVRMVVRFVCCAFHILC